MRALIAILALLTAATVQAKTLIFDLQESARVSLVKVDIEESGAVFNGGQTGVTLQTGVGEKLFRAIITADVFAYDQEASYRQNYFNRFPRIQSGKNNYGYYGVYRIRDVVRIPIQVVNGGTVDFRIHFDVTVPGLTFEGPQGLAPIDPIVRLQDNQHFGISPPAFTGSNSTSPRSVCVEFQPNPQYPMIEDCVRWEYQ